MGRLDSDGAVTRKDFFISYTGADQHWAEWIAHKLEDADYQVEIQAWDMMPGRNFVQAMDDATKQVDKIIVVLSNAYLNSDFAASEWYVAFENDPKSLSRKLIPIRVEECDVGGLLGQIVYIDFVGLTEEEAERELINKLKERGKPEECPLFPGFLQDLFNILESIDEKLVFQAFRKCKPEARSRRSDSLLQMLHRLADIPAIGDEVKPLYHFIEILVDDTSMPREVQEQLMEWLFIQGYSPSLHSSESEVLDSITDNYLMLKIQTHPTQVFIAQAALTQDPDIWDLDIETINHTISLSNPSPIKQESTKLYLQRILCEAVDSIDDQHLEIATSDLQIHWFLPISMLNFAVEQLPFPVGSRNLCAGREFKSILVRSFDCQFTRAYRRKFGDRKKYWRRIKANKDLSADQALQLLNPSRREFEVDWDDLNTVGCRFVESQNSNQQEANWDQIFCQGISIALCCRSCSVSDPDTEVAIQALIKGKITQLPITLTKQRKADLPPVVEEIPEQPTGSANLALLWDNPYRPFPSIDYVSESQ